jgi:hypothetical protein
VAGGQGSRAKAVWIGGAQAQTSPVPACTETPALKVMRVSLARNIAVAVLTWRQPITEGLQLVQILPQRKSRSNTSHSLTFQGPRIEGQADITEPDAIYPNQQISVRPKGLQLFCITSKQTFPITTSYKCLKDLQP